VTDLSSSVPRVVKQFCKGTSDFGASLLLLLVLAVASFHSSALLASLLFCVCWWGSFWLFGCGSTAYSARNSSASLMFHSLLTTSCSSATCCRRSSTWAHLSQAGLLPVPAPGEKSRHFLQSEVCTAASPFSSSIWVEASATTGIDGAHSPAGAAATALRQVPTTLP